MGLAALSHLVAAAPPRHTLVLPGTARSPQTRSTEQNVHMALISSFEERPLDPKRVHDDVVCGYAFANIGDRRILQLETYGADDQGIP
jgi:hypothetical protein